jgi:two-component system CheB/CheR fusion protein
MIRVDIADNGSGFQPGVMERLFEPFQTTKSSGMGIGLSISRMIVEAHYGKIWAEPNPKGGAIFSFTLPLVDVEVNR